VEDNARRSLEASSKNEALFCRLRVRIADSILFAGCESEKPTPGFHNGDITLPSKKAESRKQKGKRHTYSATIKEEARV
jgi:hypothetical protein